MRKRLVIVAALLGFVPFAAAKVELRKSSNAVAIVGTNWALTYGSGPDLVPQLLELSPERAYFTQGGWVRLLDTQRGVVLGRWDVGATVVRMKPAGDEQVEVRVENKKFRCMPYAAPAACPELHDSILVGPGVRVPFLQTEAMDWPAVGRREAMGQFPPFAFAAKLKPERARELLPAAKDLVSRDPYLPWASITYAHLLSDAGDPRAAEAFAGVLQSPGGDFTEWIPIAADLYAQHQDEQARAAYDRGYKDFLQRGFDPRVFASMGYRPVLFGPNQPPKTRIVDLPPEQVDRIYRLSPYVEFSWVIWQEHANSMEKQGHGADAQLWRARAADARQNAPALQTTFGLGLDRWFLIALAAVVATVAYIAAVSSSYTPQRHADMETGRRRWAVPLVSNLSYMTRTQRLALALIVIAGWIALGIAGLYAAAFTRHDFAPAAVRNGNYIGQNARWHLQRLPASPERDLLLGIAYQQGGDSRRAEETYGKLPQFAEGWNNLGVLMRRRGKDDEARQAFERALWVDPQLHEAAFNLNGSTPDFWTQLHREYLPDRPMLAVARARQLRAAYIGGTGPLLYFWSALRGPFWPADAYWVTSYVGLGRRSETWVRLAAEGFAGAALLFAVVLLLKVRRDPVYEAAGPRQRIWELAFPGTAPAWNIVGGLVLIGWAGCWMAMLLELMLHSPGIWSADAVSALRLYHRSSNEASIGPTWLWFVGTAAVLFLANAVVVLKTRARKSQPATAGASQPS